MRPDEEAMGLIPRRDENRMRTEAVLHNIPMMTTIAGARAALEGIRSLRRKELVVRSLQELTGPRGETGSRR